jgi:hypothetical protein
MLSWQSAPPDPAPHPYPASNAKVFVPEPAARSMLNDPELSYLTNVFSGHNICPSIFATGMRELCSRFFVSPRLPFDRISGLSIAGKLIKSCVIMVNF